MAVLVQAINYHYRGFRHLVYLLDGNSHPPFLYWVHEPFFVLFRDVVVADNLTGLVLYSAVSGLTFSLVAQFFSRPAALVATSFLNLHPLYLASSLNPQNEIALLLFLAWILHGLMARNYLALSVALAVLVWAKETGRVFLIVTWGWLVADLYFKRVAWRKIWPVFAAPVLSLGVWRWYLAQAGAREWNAYLFNGQKTASSMAVVLRYLGTLDVFTPFSLQNLENTFLANFNWGYTIVLLALLLVQRKVGNSIREEGRRLARLAWLFAGSYLVVVYPFPTWTEPRYALIVLAVALVSAGVLVATLPRRPVAYGTAALVSLLLVVSQRTSRDPLTALRNQNHRSTFYGVELDDWGVRYRGPDRFLYNLQLAEVARRFEALLVAQLEAGTDVVVTSLTLKGCDSVRLFFDWPMVTYRFGPLGQRPLCLTPADLVSREADLKGKRVSLLTPVTGEKEREALKAAKAVTNAFEWNGAR